MSLASDGRWFSNDIWISPEAAQPEPVAQENNGIAAWLIFFWQKGAAKQRPHL